MLSFGFILGVSGWIGDLWIFSQGIYFRFGNFKFSVDIFRVVTWIFVADSFCSISAGCRFLVVLQTLASRLVQVALVFQRDLFIGLCRCSCWLNLPYRSKRNSLLRGGSQQSSLTLTGRVIFLLVLLTSLFFLCFVHPSVHFSVLLLGLTASSLICQSFFHLFRPKPTHPGT